LPMLCRFTGHKPSPHAVLLGAHTLNRCVRCGLTLISEQGEPWVEMPGDPSGHLEAIVAMLGDPDSIPPSAPSQRIGRAHS
jgi:hypothetical protein